MSLGPMAKCKHCGVLSVDEALACEEGDCNIVDWYVQIRKTPRKRKIGSGNQATQEQAVAPRRSAAPKDS